MRERTWSSRGVGYESSISQEVAESGHDGSHDDGHAVALAQVQHDSSALWLTRVGGLALIAAEAIHGDVARACALGLRGRGGRGRGGSGGGLVGLRGLLGTARMVLTAGTSALVVISAVLDALSSPLQADVVRKGLRVLADILGRG